MVNFYKIASGLLIVLTLIIILIIGLINFNVITIDSITKSILNISAGSYLIGITAIITAIISYNKLTNVNSSVISISDDIRRNTDRITILEKSIKELEENYKLNIEKLQSPRQKKIDVLIADINTLIKSLLVITDDAKSKSTKPYSITILLEKIKSDPDVDIKKELDKLLRSTVETKLQKIREEIQSQLDDIKSQFTENSIMYTCINKIKESINKEFDALLLKKYEKSPQCTYDDTYKILQTIKDEKSYTEKIEEQIRANIYYLWSNLNISAKECLEKIITLLSPEELKKCYNEAKAQLDIVHDKKIEVIEKELDSIKQVIEELKKRQTEQQEELKRKDSTNIVGLQGPRGPPGEDGIQGPPGPTIATESMFAWSKLLQNNISKNEYQSVEFENQTIGPPNNGWRSVKNSSNKSNEAFIAPSTGYYLINYKIEVQSGKCKKANCSAILTKNNKPIIGSNITLTATTGSNESSNIYNLQHTTIAHLTQNENIKLLFRSEDPHASIGANIKYNLKKENALPLQDDCTASILFTKMTSM